MGKRTIAVLAIAGLTATLCTAMGAADAAPADGGRHLRDARMVREPEASPLLPMATDEGAVASTTDVEVHGPSSAIEAAVDAVGGVVLGEAPGVLHARVALGATEALVASPGVESVRPAPRMTPSAVSEGVSGTGASTWQTAGVDGTDVDVAIVDAGFAGYGDAILAGDLPADTNPVFGACVPGDDDLTDHGTAVAEIVHDMAPGAQIHLVCIDSAFDVDASTDATMAFLRNNDIEIANASLGWSTLSRGDGQGPFDSGVTRSRQDGTLWTVAAGNEAQKHSRVPKGASQQRIIDSASGFYIDAVDLNPGAGADRWMSMSVGPGDGNANTAEAIVEMKWDSWAASSNVDFDIYAFSSPILSESTFVSGSNFDQLTGSDPPTEGFAFSNPFSSARTFYLIVDAWQPTVAPIDIYVDSNLSGMEYPVAAGSVTEPGSSPGAFTVGAACVLNNSLEPFSSQGPTIDGRVKPDIVAPDGTNGFTYGQASSCTDEDTGFFGTSAASPHVAGAAALVLDANPNLGPAEVQAVLEQRATAAGVAGKDSVWGWGRLAMGPANAPGAPTGNLFSALSPSARLLDTRIASNPLASGSTRQIPIAGANGVPADATAVVLSVVAVQPSAAGYLTAFPAGAARPVASSLNFAKGQVISNSVTVGLGPSGAISLFNYSGSTNVVVDIAGWYGPTATNGLQSVDPIRAVDTRPGKPTRVPVPGGDIGGAEVLNVQLAGNPAIPEVPASAVAVVLNAAVTGPTITGHLTVWPDGVAKPLASNLNFDKAATVANLVVAKTGTGGRVNVATNGGKAHVILDIVGYYDVAAPGRFVALPTVNRVLDTRTGTGGPVRAAAANQTRSVAISELYGVPGDATGVVLNVTAIAPQALTGHLRVWGTGPLPTASTLNFTRGAIIGNAALVGLGPSGVLADGWFGIYNSSNSPTDVVADVSGYFVGA